MLIPNHENYTDCLLCDKWLLWISIRYNAEPKTDGSKLCVVSLRVKVSDTDEEGIFIDAQILLRRSNSQHYEIESCKLKEIKNSFWLWIRWMKLTTRANVISVDEPAPSLQYNSEGHWRRETNNPIMVHSLYLRGTP